MVKIKRAYDRAARSDGFRVLVDRLWPRGIKKTDLPIDSWEKELGPSTELRKEFGHDPAKWTMFKAKYQRELKAAAKRTVLRELAKRSRRGTVTLIYSAKDDEHNNAKVLKSVIENIAEPRT